MAGKRKPFGLLRGILSDWYGERRGNLEMTSHLPSTVHISEPLENVMGKLISPQDMKLIEIKDKWVNIAGAQIAKIASPLDIKSNILYVEVAHSAWLRELRGASKKLLIENINRFCGNDFCKDIRFVPSGGR